MNPHIQSFFDPETSTFSHLISDPSSHACVLIDPVLNYDPKSGRTRTDSADQIIAYIEAKNLHLEWLLETHAHADHLTGAHYIQEKLGGKTAISAHIKQIQKFFKNIFHLGNDFVPDGSQFDVLLKDQEKIRCGHLHITCLEVPGHTPACMAYVMEDCIFVGDTLFMPDVGTARCDFPAGDAKTLYQSVQHILQFPETTKLYLCHDYPPNGRKENGMTTVGQERSKNIHIHDGISEAAFVEMRTARDKTLEMPVLILPAIQVNICAGKLPKAESNGVQYLKIPMNLM